MRAGWTLFHDTAPLRVFCIIVCLVLPVPSCVWVGVVWCQACWPKLSSVQCCAGEDDDESRRSEETQMPSGNTDLWSDKHLLLKFGQVEIECDVLCVDDSLGSLLFWRVATLRLRARNERVGVINLSTIRLSHGLRRKLRADTRERC